jgi:soluble lytic murein transglycosylase-like protein
MRHVWITLVLALLSPGPSPAAARDVPVQQLTGIRTLFAAARADIESLSGDLALARWEEFERVAAAVLGPEASRAAAPADIAAAFGADAPLAVPADAALRARDRLALQMALTGYPAEQIADVLAGRITLGILTQARRMRMLGRPEADVARYLDGQVEAIARARAAVVARESLRSRAVAPVPPRPWDPRAADRERWDAVVLDAARRHGVDPDLVRAVIRHESAWNPFALSPKGALGLMQLMPGTARLLGVNPLDPEENIEGGTRYLTALLGMFGGNLEAAILGYIAGPGYARAWLRGDVVPYGEIRAYLTNVKRTYLTARAAR